MYNNKLDTGVYHQANDNTQVLTHLYTHLYLKTHHFPTV